MNVLYREWTEVDCKAVAALEKKCFADPWSLEMVNSSFSESHFFGYVAENEGDLVGYVGMSLVFDTADVLLVAVEEKFRGRGIATEHLNISFIRARDSGGERAMLEVDTKNISAIYCYNRLGFEIISERKNYYGENKDAFIMEKCLLNDL